MTGNGRVHPLPIADVVPASTPDFFNKIRQRVTSHGLDFALTNDERDPASMDWPASNLTCLFRNKVSPRPPPVPSRLHQSFSIS
jgi:hypothetical protein